MTELVDIRCVQLVKRFGKSIVLDRLDLTLVAGTSLGLVGPSGAGKSTLLRIIAGLDRCTSGQMLFTAPGTFVERPRPKIGMVFQNLALWPHLTARQQIECVLSSEPRRERRVRVDALLAEARVPSAAWKRLPGQLSGGEAQRVALARALAPNPQILLLDEPLVHVDTFLRGELLAHMKAVTQARSSTIVYVTHCRPEAEALCQRVIELEQGRLVGAESDIPPTRSASEGATHAIPR